MRIAFDARVLDRPELATRGIGRYTQSLLEALQAAHPGNVVELRGLRRPPLPERVSELSEHPLLARDVRRSRADVLHSPSIDFATVRPGTPYVVTVHDLVPLKHSERYLRTGIKHRARYAAVKRATSVVTPTRAVAADCERLLGIAAAQIYVIPEAPASVFRAIDDPRSVLARLDLPEHFLLWVGGLDPPDPRKRVHELAAAATSRGAELVLAGAHGLTTIHGARMTGRLSDEELAALYSAADCLVIPSEEEGFGLPAMEALACGTPVVAFAIDALRELYAENTDVTLVEPGDFKALLDAADAVRGHRAAPPTRTWADVAAETWSVYESAHAKELLPG